MTENNTYYVRDTVTELINTIEITHGNQLCLILKDGEQVDVVWVDEDVILRDNVFLTENTPVDSAEVITEQTKLRSHEVKTFLSRKYLNLIIETCIKNKLINLPESVHLFDNSPYIVLSDADKFIDTEKYPNMDEYLKECNAYKYCNKGDNIIVVHGAAGSNYTNSVWGRSYGSYRGNGDADRAHDAYLQPGMDKINLIKHIDSKYEDSVQVYVSCDKTFSETAKANVRVYSDEYINLTYVSSNHIKYWIDTKKVGTSFSLSYAQICTYLKEALSTVRERELQEFELINKYIQFDYNESNIDKLTEYKFKYKVRSINRLTVKNFVKEISNGNCS